MIYRLLSKSVLITLLISLPIIASYSQTKYDDYQKSDLERVYLETFSTPNSKWEVYRSGSRMGKIQDGALDWISMNNSAQMIWHTLSDMDWDRDWQIEIRMKHLTGKSNSSNDLVWNIQDNSKYHFGFTAEGKYVISEKIPDEYRGIVPFTKSSTVNKEDYNTITVRKVGFMYHFFFNQELISSKSGLSVVSNKIGFMAPPNSTLQVDYLDVSYLNSKETVSSTVNQFAYYGIMTKYSGLTTQRWKTRDDFPKDEIKADWDNGYYISDLSYDNNKWSLITSKGTGYSTQNWITRNEWPKSEIKEKWNEGFHITELNYGNGVWAFVFSKNSGYSGQRWATSASFPREKIKEFGDNDLWITEIAYGDDRWAVVGSKDSDIRGQKWYKTAEFPESKINEQQRNGFSVTQLSYQNGLWVLIMTKYTSNRPQQLITSNLFPKDEIRNYWDLDYHLTDVTYGGESRSPNSSTTKSIVRSANERISDLIVGRWYGGVPSETDKGYFVFEEDKFVSMINNGETVGGESYEVDGTVLDLKYEIDNSSSPFKIDLVFYYEDSDLGRLKGLINMIDDDTFEIIMSGELSDSRPTSLKQEGGENQVAIFKRVNE